MHPLGKTLLVAWPDSGCNRVSPVGKREARRKRAFVCFLPHNRRGGRRSTGEGAAAASVPCPSSPSVSRSEQFSPLSSFRLASNTPAPTSSPHPQMSSPSQRSTRHGWDLPSHFWSNSKQRAISKGNEDPSDNQGRGKSMSLKVNGNALDCYPALWIWHHFISIFFWRTPKAILQSSSPHRDWRPAFSFQTPLVFFWDSSLPWEISEAEASPSLSFLSVHLDYRFYSTSVADAPLCGGEGQKIPLVRWEPSILNFLCSEGRGENQDSHSICWFRCKLKLKFTSMGFLPTRQKKWGREIPHPWSCPGKSNKWLTGFLS